MQHQDTVVIDGYKQEIAALKHRIESLNKKLDTANRIAVLATKQCKVLSDELRHEIGVNEELREALQPLQTEMQVTTNNTLQDELGELRTTNLRLKTELENTEYKAAQIEEFFMTTYKKFAPVFDDADVFDNGEGGTIRKTLFYDVRGYLELKKELIERMA